MYIYIIKGERKSIIMNINKAGVEIYIYSRSEGDMKEKKKITCILEERGDAGGYCYLTTRTKKSSCYAYKNSCNKSIYTYIRKYLLHRMTQPSFL